MLAQQHTISVVAGGSAPKAGKASEASLGGVEYVTADSAGNLYISTEQHCVWKLDRAGMLTPIAGIGKAGFSGDGGPATSAELYYPMGLTLDQAGNLYIADSLNFRVRKVTPGGIISTFFDASRPTDGFGSPRAVAFGPAGDLYVAYSTSNWVRKVSSSGMVTDVYTSAMAAGYQCVDLAVDHSGNVYIPNHDAGSRIRKVTSTGAVMTVAGNGSYGWSGDGGPATQAALKFPRALTLDEAGNLYFVDQNRVRKVGTDGKISTIAGSEDDGFAGDGGPASLARLNSPTGIVADRAGSLFIADFYNFRLRRIAPDGTITTAAGNGTIEYSGDGGRAIDAQVNPWKMAMDAEGNAYFSDAVNHVVRKIAIDGTITTVAGTGTPGYSGDGGPAKRARLSIPDGVAVDASGNLYIADGTNHWYAGYDPRIRKVSRDGTISTAGKIPMPAETGSGSGTFITGGPGPAYVLASDASGNLYFTDGYGRIDRLLPGGLPAVVAGTTTPGYSGDGGPAALARLRVPQALAFDRRGNLYIADTGNGAIRKIDTGGTISTVVQRPGQQVMGLTVDGDSNVYFAQYSDGQIWKLTPDGYRILAASSRADSGWPYGAISSDLKNPRSLAAGEGGAVYIAVFGMVLRLVSPRLPSLKAAFSPTHLVQGRAGNLAITIRNAGVVATDGRPVTIDLGFAKELALVEASGSGWICAGRSCTRSDPLPPRQLSRYRFESGRSSGCPGDGVGLGKYLRRRVAVHDRDNDNRDPEPDAMADPAQVAAATQ